MLKEIADRMNMGFLSLNFNDPYIALALL